MQSARDESCLEVALQRVEPSRRVHVQVAVTTAQDEQVIVRQGTVILVLDWRLCIKLA